MKAKKRAENENGEKKKDNNAAKEYWGIGKGKKRLRWNLTQVQKR